MKFHRMVDSSGDCCNNDKDKNFGNKARLQKDNNPPAEGQSWLPSRATISEGTVPVDHGQRASELGFLDV